MYDETYSYRAHRLIQKRADFSPWYGSKAPVSLSLTLSFHLRELNITMPKDSPIAIEKEANTSKLDLRSLLLTKPIRKKIKKYFKNWLMLFFTKQAPSIVLCKSSIFIDTNNKYILFCYTPLLDHLSRLCTFLDTKYPSVWKKQGILSLLGFLTRYIPNGEGEE